MRNLTIVIWLCIGAMTGIETANAQSATTSTVLPCATAACKGAPAPSIGTGVPGVLVIGGILIGASLLMRRRRRATMSD